MFNTIKVFTEIEARNFLSISQIEKEVVYEPKNQLLNVDESSYIQYLIDKYKVEPLVLEWDNAFVEAIERDFSAQKCKQNTPMYFGEFSEPCRKQVIIYSIPFSGEKRLLNVRPSSFSHWTISINVNENSISFEIVNWDND